MALPQVQFYQIDNNNSDLVNKLICDLLYNFYSNSRSVFILCPSLEFLNQLDEYIINYINHQFFTYQRITDGPIPPAKIILDNLSLDKNNNIINNFKYIKQDILFNLTTNIPKSFVKYKKIIQLVDKDKQNRFISREHYKYYHKYQCPIEFIKFK